MTSNPASGSAPAFVESPAEAAARSRLEEVLASIEWRVLDRAPEARGAVAEVERELGHRHAEDRRASAGVESALTAVAGVGGGARQRVALTVAVLAVLGGACAIAGPLADGRGRGWGLVLAIVATVVVLAAVVGIVAGRLTQAVALVGGAQRLSLPFAAGACAVVGAVALVVQLANGTLDDRGATPFLVLATALTALASLVLGVVDLVQVRAFKRAFAPATALLVESGQGFVEVAERLGEAIGGLSDEERDCLLEARRDELRAAVAAGAVDAATARVREAEPLGWWAVLRHPGSGPDARSPRP